MEEEELNVVHVPLFASFVSVTDALPRCPSFQETTSLSFDLIFERSQTRNQVHSSEDPPSFSWLED